jgi:hypothetical protein
MAGRGRRPGTRTSASRGPLVDGGRASSVGHVVVLVHAANSWPGALEAVAADQDRAGADQGDQVRWGAYPPPLLGGLDWCERSHPSRRGGDLPRRDLLHQVPRVRADPANQGGGKRVPDGRPTKYRPGSVSTTRGGGPDRRWDPTPAA